MTTFLAQHDGISIAEEPTGDRVLAIDAHGGLETMIRFNAVEDASGKWVFHFDGVRVGSVERDDLGDVSEWLDGEADR